MLTLLRDAESGLPVPARVAGGKASVVKEAERGGSARISVLCGICGPQVSEMKMSCSSRAALGAPRSAVAHPRSFRASGHLVVMVIQKWMTRRAPVAQPWRVGSQRNSLKPERLTERRDSVSSLGSASGSLPRQDKSRHCSICCPPRGLSNRYILITPKAHTYVCRHTRRG